MNRALERGPSDDRIDERGTSRLVGGLILAVAAGGVISALYATRYWWFPPLASVEGAQVDGLMALFFVITGVVFAGVHVALAVFVMRHPAAGGRRALHWHESSRLELTWTVLPAVVLVLLTIASGLAWFSLRVHPAAAASPHALTLEVRAQQFAWNVRYPGPDGVLGRTDPRLVTAGNPFGIDPQDPAGADDVVTVNDLRLPVDRPVRVILHAKDVIHSFFVPAFRVKQDVVPGRTTEVSFVPSKVGEYELACAELCGAGHYVMRSPLKVMPEPEFNAWLAGQVKARR